MKDFIDCCVWLIKNCKPMEAIKNILWLITGIEI